MLIKKTMYATVWHFLWRRKKGKRRRKRRKRECAVLLYEKNVSMYGITN